MATLNLRYALRFFFGLFSMVIAEGSFSELSSTLPLNQAVGSTVVISLQVTQSSAIGTIRWKFNTITVAEINNVIISSTFTGKVEDSIYKPRLNLSAVQSPSNNRVVETSLTFSNLTDLDSGIIITVTLVDSGTSSTSGSVVLNVTVCPVQGCASYATTASCTYNQFDCTSEVTCCDESVFTSTCLANATWSTSEICAAPNPPLPGWAIFLIILGALVLVFGGLFIAWWCIQAFRECLHGVSECFPEDHCCGKDYSKGSSS